MSQGSRWIIGVLFVVAVVALILFARGTPEHAEPTAPPAALVVATIV